MLLCSQQTSYCNGNFWTQNSVAFCCPNIGVIVGHQAAMAKTIWAYILGSFILFDNSKRRQMNSTQNLVVYKVAKTYQKRFSQAEANLGKWNVFYSALGIVMGPSLNPTQAWPIHFLGLVLEILRRAQASSLTFKARDQSGLDLLWL